MGRHNNYYWVTHKMDSVSQFVCLDDTLTKVILLHALSPYCSVVQFVCPQYVVTLTLKFIPKLKQKRAFEHIPKLPSLSFSQQINPMYSVPSLIQ